MVRIAICDDEVAVGAELENTLLGIFEGLRHKCEVEVFFSGDELYRQMQTGAVYDLIFLDIEFAQSQHSGVEIGSLIRKESRNYTTAIVYISWENKYAMQLFDIQPMNFLIKPLQYDKIKQTVDTYLLVAGNGKIEFVYKKKHDICKVPIRDLVYLENRQRKIILSFSDKRKEEFYGSLKDVYQQQLQARDFLFIHASFVVNYDYITTVQYSQLYVSGYEGPLPISNNRRNEVREQYLSILKKRRGH